MTGFYGIKKKTRAKFKKKRMWQRVIRMPKEKNKYEPPNPRRTYTIMTPDEANSGKKSLWQELEISGNIRNVSNELFKYTNLTSLYLNDNCLIRLSPEICKLQQLKYLDLSSNKLRSLPAEIGEMTNLRELLLDNNFLRLLPYEIGRLFQLQTLGLQGNPLSPEISSLYNDMNGTSKLLSFLLDHLHAPRSEPRLCRTNLRPVVKREKTDALGICGTDLVPPS
ncbi:CCR4-NOT transcription complex subunit 6-like [Tubulanus polymorphus]|uniref:CCR4-NOT transcription complex subunit 6-like n=1 Tax=Tubulanus polymorphus TaxID=672921 RepID=UPI003DA61749